ncbi:hypothetical protein [Rhodoplanes sp. SY1]|uniref:hypothetical protein n=1 Tax=Rhodoplanes sp. SY1 TaxID=3166646 RepID=UPI0038B54B17
MDSSMNVPAAFGLVTMLVSGGPMLLSGTSAIDSTFTSTVELVARDWRNDGDGPRAFS